MRIAQSKRIAENKREAQAMQRKLLAIAGDYQVGSNEDQQLEMNRPREETKSRPSDGRNTTPSKIIDLANSEEESEPLIPNTNLVGISPRKNEACRTQLRTVCSKGPKDLFEGAVGRKLEDGKTKEKTKRVCTSQESSQGYRNRFSQ